MILETAVLPGLTLCCPRRQTLRTSDTLHFGVQVLLQPLLQALCGHTPDWCFD